MICRHDFMCTGVGESNETRHGGRDGNGADKKSVRRKYKGRTNESIKEGGTAERVFTRK